MNHDITRPSVFDPRPLAPYRAQPTPPDGLERGQEHDALAAFLGTWRAEGKSYGNKAQTRDEPRAHETRLSALFGEIDYRTRADVGSRRFVPVTSAYFLRDSLRQREARPMMSAPMFEKYCEQPAVAFTKSKPLIRLPVFR